MRRLGYAALLFYYFGTAAVAGQVTLKNGDRLTGTIVKTDGSTGGYRYGFNSNVATKLKNWLGWQVTFNDNYISNPPTRAMTFCSPRDCD
jgi:hypothetical protein